MNGHCETIGTALGATLLVAGTQLDNADVQQCAFALGFGTIGACLGALAASMVGRSIGTQEMRKRFQINLFCGIPLGIASGYAVNHFFDYVPLWASLLGAAAVCGWLGVKSMVIAVKKYGKKQ